MSAEMGVAEEDVRALMRLVVQLDEEVMWRAAEERWAGWV